MKLFNYVIFAQTTFNTSAGYMPLQQLFYLHYVTTYLTSYVNFYKVLPWDGRYSLYKANHFDRVPRQPFFFII